MGKIKYPFTPDILDSIPEEIAELYRGLEIELLKDICSRLKISGKANEVTLQDIRALRSHGIPLEQIKKAISDTSGLAMHRVDEILNEVVEKNNEFYHQIADLSGLTVPDVLVDEKDIQAICKQTKSELQNITQSMAFVVRDSRGNIPLQPAKAYQRILDQATIKVQSGAFGYNKAIADSVRQLADSGLRIAEYDKDGKKFYNQIDVAARRAIMTGVNQLNQKYREQSMDYLDTDLVETTAHLGARNIDGPNGWEAHTKWQGRVFHWNRVGNRISNYPDFEEKCGYGSVTGIGGANCRHSFYPYVDGVMERSYTDKELESMKPENRTKIEFDGKEYDDYEATQQQRRIEAEIRKLKRREAAYNAAGNEEEAKETLSRIRRLNEKYREFSKAAGLRTQFERMRVFYN